MRPKVGEGVVPPTYRVLFVEALVLPEEVPDSVEPVGVVLQGKSEGVVESHVLCLLHRLSNKAVRVYD